MSNYKAFYQYRHEVDKPEVFGYICRKNESFDGLILEDAETGERFNYVEVQGGFGLEPLGGHE